MVPTCIHLLHNSDPHELQLFPGINLKQANVFKTVQLSGSQIGLKLIYEKRT